MTSARLASRFEQSVLAYTAWLLKYRWLVLLLSLASVAALGYGVRYLAFSTDYRVYFGPDNPQLQVFDEFQKVYNKNDNTVVMFQPRSGDAAGDIFQPRVLEAIRKFTADAWRQPYVVRVNSITSFPHSRGVGDDLVVESLLPDDVHITPERIQQLRAATLAEPLLVKRLVSPSGHVAGVVVVTEFQGASELEIPEHVQAMRALRDRILAEYPEVEIALSGTNLFNISFTEASQHDLRVLYPLMVALSTLIIWLTLRSVSATAATGVLIMLSALAAMGGAGWLGITLTPPALAAPLVIMTLAVADSVHLYQAMFAAMRRGASKHEAILESVRVNMTPIFFTAITTAVGFLTLYFTDSPPLHDLGYIAAAGVMLAWLYSVFTMPAVMWLLPVTAPPQRKGLLIGAMGRLADFVIRRRKAVFWGTALVSAALMACIPLNRVNDMLVTYFDHSIQFRRDTDRIAANLTGMAIMDISLKAQGSNGISDPAYLKQVEAFATWWQAQPEVKHVAAVTDIYKRLNRNLHGDDPAWYRLPDNRELAAQYMLLYELSLPAGLDLTDSVNIDKSSSRFTVIFDVQTSSEMRALVERGERWLKQNAPQIFSPATGPQVMFMELAERNIKSMMWQVPFSILLIWLLLMPALRSFKVGVLALIPLSFPVAIAFGIWGLIDGTVIFTMAIVLGVITGIADDDVVHFLSHYLRGRREQGLSPQNALRHAFETAGSAMVATTAILVAGFLVIAQSAFLPNGGFSQLGAIAITVALIFDLLLLPPLILWVDRAPVPAAANSEPAGVPA